MRGHQMKGGDVREVKCGVGAVMSEEPGLMRQLKKFPTALPASRPTGSTNTTTMNRNHNMRPFHDGWTI